MFHLWKMRCLAFFVYKYSRTSEVQHTNSFHSEVTEQFGLFECDVYRK